MSLPREILKWIQGLDLSYSVKNPKRDFSNGFLLAEILARYYKEVPLHSFDTGSAMVKKADNWEQLTKLLHKHGFNLSKETMEGVMHQKNGFALSLLENIYTFLTKRKIQNLPGLEHEEVPKPNYAPPTTVSRSKGGEPAGEKSPMASVTDAEGVEQKSKHIAAAKMPEHKPSSQAPQVMRKLSPPKENVAGQNNVTFKEVKVKTLDNALALRTMRSELASAQPTTQETSQPLNQSRASSGPSMAHEDALQPLLSSICQTCFSGLGVSFDAKSTSASDDDAVPENHISMFVSHLHKLGDDVKAVVWGAIVDEAPKIASLIKAKPQDFFTFVCCFSYVFDTMSPFADDWVQA